MAQRRATSKLGSFWAPLAPSVSRFPVLVAAAGLLAIGLRAANVAALGRVLGYRQILDAAFYHDEARFLAGATSTPLDGGPVRFANPGYPEMLAALYRVLGADERVALAAQAVGGGLCAVLLGYTARHLFSDRRAGVFAALLWALYTPAIYYDGALLTASFTALFTALALAASTAFMNSVPAVPSEPPKTRPAHLLALAFGIGLCLGGLVWLRASNALFGVTLAGLLLHGGRHVPRFRRVAGAFLLGGLLVVGPGILRQHAQSGEWVPVSANGGMNFWVGNNRDADGTYVPAAFLATTPSQGHEYTVIVERNAFLEEARRLSHDPTLGLSRASAFWRARAIDDVLDDPLRSALLELKKLTLFFNRYESWNNVSSYFLEHFSPILRFDPLGFGLLTLLAAYGFVAFYEDYESRARLLLLLSVAAPLAACLVFFVSGEYRHAASVPLTLAAAFTLSRLRRGERHWPFARPHAISRALVAALTLGLVFYPVPRPGYGDNARAYVDWLATVHPDGEKPTRSAYARALVVLDTMSEAFVDQVIKREELLLVYLNRAIQFSDAGSAAELVATASELWRMDPTPKNGVPVYLAQRVHDDLQLRVEQLASQPFLSDAPTVLRDLSLLGAHGYEEIRDYLRNHRLAEAKAFATSAVKLAPTSAPALAEYGRVELNAGDPRAAVPWLQQSLEAWPKIATPAVLLCEYYLTTKDVDRAARSLREAVARDPGDPELLALQRSLGARP